MKKHAAPVLCIAMWAWCAAALSQESTRPGEIRDSGGRVLEGRISGKDFALYVDEKLRVIPFTQVREIRFTPKKIYATDPLPARELEAIFRLADHQIIAGRLVTAILSVETEDGLQKIVLQAKQRATEGQSLQEMAYVTRVVFQDSPRAETPERIRVRFAARFFGPEAAVRAITRKTLIPFDLTKTETPGVYTMPSIFGENLYVAAREGKRVLVSWPVRDEKDLTPEEKAREKALFAATDAALQKEKSPFDTRRLIAVRIEDLEVHALVSQRRMTEQKWADPPWQLALWRWKFENDYRDMRYDTQKPLFAESRLAPDAIPEIRLSKELWKMEKKGEDLLEIGALSTP